MICLLKSCKSVVNLYIFTANILFLVWETVRGQKNIGLCGWGRDGAGGGGMVDSHSGV